MTSQHSLNIKAAREAITKRNADAISKAESELADRLKKNDRLALQMIKQAIIDKGVAYYSGLFHGLIAGVVIGWLIRK